MSWRNHLRLGIIFTVTGAISLGHAVFTTNGQLPSGVDFVIGIALIVVGVPLLVTGVRKRSGKAGPPTTPDFWPNQLLPACRAFRVSYLPVLVTWPTPGDKLLDGIPKGHRSSVFFLCRDFRAGPQAGLSKSLAGRLAGRDIDLSRVS
jgi:hypothetical protein